MAPSWRARATTAIYDLIFSVHTGYRGGDLFEAICRVTDLVQLSAYAMNPDYTGWQMNSFQTYLQYSLLDFGSNDDLSVLWAFIALILFTDVCLALVGWQTSTYGAAPRKWHVKVCQYMFDFSTKIAFLPLCDVVFSGLQVSWSGPATDVLTTIGLPTLIIVVVVLGFLIPAVATTALLWPEHSALTGFSRICPRQMIGYLLFKFLVSLTYWATDSYSASRYIGCALNCAMLASVYVVPFFASGLTNLLAIVSLAIPTFLSVITVTLPFPGQDAGFSATYHQYTALVGSIVFSALCCAVFMLRMTYLLPKYNFWAVEIKNARYYFTQLLQVGQGQKGGAVQECDIPMDVLLARCRYPFELILACDSLLLSSRFTYAPIAIQLLRKGITKFPESVIVKTHQIIYMGMFGDNSVKTRSTVQIMIRKLVGRKLAAFDTQYAYYRILKLFEIATYQSLHEFRGKKAVDIARYIYLYNAARKEHLHALKLAVKFWNMCGRERQNILAIDHRAARLQTHQTKALHMYSSLIASFPNSVPALKSYAAFTLDVLNCRNLAEEILQYAVLLNEEHTDRDRKITESKGDLAAKTQISLRLRSKPTEGGMKPEGEDNQSEYTAGSGLTQNSNLVNSISASSIFDFEAWEERRNGVALKRLRHMRKVFFITLAVFICCLIALYVIGFDYEGREVSDRANLLLAGLMRNNFLRVGLYTRRIQLAVQNNISDLATITSLQSTLNTTANSGKSRLDTLFLAIGKSTWWKADYWVTQSISDPVTGDLYTPWAYITSVFNKGIAIGSTNVTSPSFQMADLVWMGENAKLPAYLDVMTQFVASLVGTYQDTVHKSNNMMTTIAVIISVMPMILFLLVFIPVWHRISDAMSSTTKLYTRIPRRIAQLIETELKDCLKEHLEMEGIDSIDQGHHHPSDHDNDEHEKGQESAQAIPSNFAVQQLLYIGIGIMLFLVAIATALSMCFISPFQLAMPRAAIVNYNGWRSALVINTYTLLNEFANMAPSNPNISIYHDALHDRIDTLTHYHQAVVFGYDPLYIPRTFGLLPQADIATFIPVCQDVTKTSCWSIDQSILWVVHTIEHALSSGVPVNQQYLDEYFTIVQNSSTYFVQTITNLSNVYGALNQNWIDAANQGAMGIFASSFPCYFILLFLLNIPFRNISKAICQVRNILFNLPMETQNNVPQIRNFLTTGLLPSSGRTMSDRWRKLFPSLRYSRARKAAEANLRIREEAKGALLADNADGSDKELKSQLKGNALKDYDMERGPFTAAAKKVVRIVSSSEIAGEATVLKAPRAQLGAAERRRPILVDIKARIMNRSSEGRDGEAPKLSSFIGRFIPASSKRQPVAVDGDESSKGTPSSPDLPIKEEPESLSGTSNAHGAVTTHIFKRGSKGSRGSISLPPRILERSSSNVPREGANLPEDVVKDPPPDFGSTECFGS